MRPRERRESGEQDLFRSRLDQVINMDHALAKLARTVDWGFWKRSSGRFTPTVRVGASQLMGCNRYQLGSNRNSGKQEQRPRKT
jgi:hypothetical protein